MKTVSMHSQSIMMGAYDRERIMAKQMIAHIGVFDPKDWSPIAINAPDNNDFCLDALDAPEASEIREYLIEHTGKMMLCEINGEATIFSAALYPSSSLCLVMRPLMPIGIFLRIIKEQGIGEHFTVSKYVKASPSRLTKSKIGMREQARELWGEIVRTLMSPERLELCLDSEEVRNEILEMIYATSTLVGCPIRIETDGECDTSLFGATDTGLLTAFLITALISAKNRAKDRCATVSVSSRSGTLKIGVSFKPLFDGELIREMIVWERIAADKNMLFEFYDEDGFVHVSFNPYRTDWSYLGIKQEVSSIFD